MNKPKKKKHIQILDKNGKGYRSTKDWIKYGYNQCWDDREKWLKEFLPSEEELLEMLTGKVHIGRGVTESLVAPNETLKRFAKAISKRIR